jgi:hypothetical protein
VIPYTLDVTASRYDLLDVELCTLFIPVPRKLPEVLSLELWGVILKPNDDAVLSELQRVMNFDLRRESAFLAGYGSLAIERPRQVELFVALYQADGADFLRDDAGVVCLAQSWGTPAADTVEYNLGGVLAWPLGNCALDVWAAGRASLTFDPRACIPTSVAMASIHAREPAELRNLPLRSPRIGVAPST